MYGREKEVWVDNQPEEYTLSMALSAGWLEDIWDMIDAQASEDEMLAKGYDPDMVNEYCCDSVQDWSSVDALYGPQDAALIALKKKRAAKILKKEDPGMLTAEEKKIATVIPRPGSTPNAQPAAASQAKQTSSQVKAGRAPIPPQKEQPVGNPSEGKKLGIFDYIALYKMSLRSFFWRVDGRQGLKQLDALNPITGVFWFMGAMFSYGLPILFLWCLLCFVQSLLMKPLALINPILASSAGMQPGAYLGISAMSAFLFLLCSPVVVNKDRLFYNLKFKDSAWWRNTGITPREISKDKGLYGEYIATMAAELNMKKYGLHGRVFNSVIVPKADGNFNEVDLVCVNETGIHVIEMRYVIEPALEEINATTDITVSVEEVREEGTTGKMKTVGYRFHLKEKTHEEKQIIMGTWGIPFDDILMLEEGQRPDFKDLEQEPDLPFKCDE